MAASYPLEIVEAARWSQANPNLKGDAAVTAVADKTWDVSVKSLVAFPSILKQLNEHLDWTQKLGDAMIGQQQDVATSIQRLRAKAAAAGTLKTGKEQTVTTQTQGSETIIAIQPTDPRGRVRAELRSEHGLWPVALPEPIRRPTTRRVARLLRWPRRGAWALLRQVRCSAAGTGAMADGNSYTNVNANRAANIDRNFNRANVGTGRSLAA